MNEERKEGKKERRKEGREEGRKEGRKEETTKRRIESLIYNAETNTFFTLPLVFE